MENGLLHIFLGIAQEDIEVGDILIINTTTNGTFSVSKANASCVYEAGTTVKIADMKIIESKPIDRCKRMVVVKKEFSNENSNEDKL